MWKWQFECSINNNLDQTNTMGPALQSVPCHTFVEFPKLNNYSKNIPLAVLPPHALSAIWLAFMIRTDPEHHRLLARSLPDDSPRHIPESRKGDRRWEAGRTLRGHHYNEHCGSKRSLPGRYLAGCDRASGQAWSCQRVRGGWEGRRRSGWCPEIIWRSCSLNSSNTS